MVFHPPILVAVVVVAAVVVIVAYRRLAQLIAGDLVRDVGPHQDADGYRSAEALANLVGDEFQPFGTLVHPLDQRHRANSAGFQENPVGRWERG